MRPARRIIIRMLVAAGLAGIVPAGCGGDPYCGDGHTDPGEECDDGNSDETDFCFSSCIARRIPSLTIKWSFNEDESLGFSGDSCTDTGAREVDVAISGPYSETKTESCSFRQVQFMDLPSGSYDISVTPKDAEGVALTSSASTAQFQFEGVDAETTVIVPFDAWLDSFNGNFFFRLMWGGADCAEATAVVDMQVLDLTRDGAYIATETKALDSLQGAASPCRSTGDSEPQTVLDVPFGPVTLFVQGLDAEAAVVYEGTFETFVGAGVNNPELTFDVPAAP